jgi:hypothetical protein
MTAIVMLSLFLTGCATVFKGYYDEVSVIDYQEGITITNHHGERIIVHDKIKSNAVANPYIAAMEKTDSVSIGKVIYLDTSENHVLTIRNGEREKIVTARRRLGIGWLLLDTVLGVYPLVIDSYTGCWFRYDPVDLTLQ